MDDELGLRRGAVSVRAYDAEWPRLFQVERRLLLDRLGSSVVAVEHVGSTAVPGLASKPIVDLMVGLDHLTAYPSLLGVLEGLGYAFMPDRVYDDRVFLSKGPESRRTHHLHLVEAGSSAWTNALRFRDWLRAEECLREEYQRLKVRLAGRYGGSRADYTEGKRTFIERTIALD